MFWKPGGDLQRSICIRDRVTEVEITAFMSREVVHTSVGSGSSQKLGSTQGLWYSSHVELYTYDSIC